MLLFLLLLLWVVLGVFEAWGAVVNRLARVVDVDRGFADGPAVLAGDLGELGVWYGCARAGARGRRAGLLTAVAAFRGECQDITAAVGVLV